MGHARGEDNEDQPTAAPGIHSEGPSHCRALDLGPSGPYFHLQTWILEGVDGTDQTGLTASSPLLVLVSPPWVRREVSWSSGGKREAWPWQTFLSRQKGSQPCQPFCSEMEEQRNAALFEHSDDLEQKQPHLEAGRIENAATIHFTVTVQCQEYKITCL